MKAILRQIRISPKKVNLVAGLVRKKSVADALSILKFTPKKAAGILLKVIQSAASNAEKNFNQDREKLMVKEIIINEGATFKRSNAVSKGRAHPILKRTTHITVFVEAKNAALPASKAKPENAGKTDTSAAPVTETAKKEKPAKTPRKKTVSKPKKEKSSES